MYRTGTPYSPHDDTEYTLFTIEATESSLQGDLVYFSPQNGNRSYGVYLDRRNDMSEEDVDDFIHSKDPKLSSRPGYISTACPAPLPTTTRKEIRRL